MQAWGEFFYFIYLLLVFDVTGDSQRSWADLGHVCLFPRWDRASGDFAEIVAVDHGSRGRTVAGAAVLLHGKTTQVNIVMGPFNTERPLSYQRIWHSPASAFYTETSKAEYK